MTRVERAKMWQVGHSPLLGSAHRPATRKKKEHTACRSLSLVAASLSKDGVISAEWQMPPCGTAQRKSGVGGAARQHHSCGLRAAVACAQCRSRGGVSRDQGTTRSGGDGGALGSPQRCSHAFRALHLCCRGSFRREVTRINSDRPRRGPSRTAASVARKMEKAKEGEAQNTSCVRVFVCVGGEKLGRERGGGDKGVAQGPD